MSLSTDKINVSPIFNGLTRPPMIYGVTLEYISISGLLSLCLFILTNSPIYLAIYFPLHITGWLACKFDYHIFHILIKRAECGYSSNQKIWGCRSYEPY